MRWCNDPTGRFSQRPYYPDEELDRTCEALIVEHLERLYGRTVIPVPTDAVTTLLERHVEELDLYADLSNEGPDVEGVTEFRRNERPVVQISAALSEDPRREHRLRTTLAHEFGHVHFHTPLFDHREESLDLFPETSPPFRQVCKRGTMLKASNTDWLEWQAGFCSSAFLMPVGVVRKAVVDHLDASGLTGLLPEEGCEAKRLIAKIADQFDVSQDAARIRLSRLDYIGRHVLTPGLYR